MNQRDEWWTVEYFDHVCEKWIAMDCLGLTERAAKAVLCDSMKGELGRRMKDLRITKVVRA